MKHKEFCIAYIIAALLFCACGSTTETEPEEGESASKTITTTDVHLEGEQADLIFVTENARCLLSPANKGEWFIQVVIPMGNTKTWDIWTKELNNGDRLAPNLEYDACMSEMKVILLDANGKEINCRMELTGDNVESLLSAETEAKEEVAAKSYKVGNYETMSAIFKQVKGVVLKKLDLDKIQHSAMSNSLGEDEAQIDFEGIYNKAKQGYIESSQQQ